MRRDVDVLLARSVLGNGRAHKHVVQLLHAAAKRVRVALVDGNARSLVRIDHARDAGKRLAGLHDGNSLSSLSSILKTIDGILTENIRPLQLGLSPSTKYESVNL